LKRIFFIVMGLWPFLIVSLAQNVPISGQPNHYLKVNNVLTDRVSIKEIMGGELDEFLAGDKVMLIQMTGVTIDSTIDNFKTTQNFTKKAVNNTGKFEILQVAEVNISGTDTLVVFTHNLANTYDAGEKIQLVKFVEGETVTMVDSVTALDWNGEVGGVVAIIATGSIKLNSNINVSAQGFRGGAVPTENYPGGCRNDLGTGNDQKDTLHFLPTEINRSGNKGEGIINASWPYTKGTAFNINGGGAGNGLYSGGGGGSNYKSGGMGGKQCNTCSGLSVGGGWGGYASQELYYDDTVRMIMGGGGGSGTKMPGLIPLSKGGDGGGLVVIITDTLISATSISIRANGESASETPGSGGGGGAGGTILIDATNYNCPDLKVEIKGGKGGNTTTVPNVNGAGGGGSGGVFWYAGTSFATTKIDSANGPGGIAINLIVYPAQQGRLGQFGKELKNLIIPLTGFLFNTVRGTDIICAGQVPGMLMASQPKGGTGEYNGSYWQQSTDSMNWLTATGGINVALRTFQPPALYQTTWYRRVVMSDTITDISRAVKIHVYPAISNNIITGTDTICYNNDAKPLNGISAPTGGNGSFSYKWQESNIQTAWDTNTVGSEAAFNPDVLTSSTYYRRVVTSTAYCSDTSNLALITVLPSIINNGFSAAGDTICENSSPGKLNALQPGGGDGSYSYAWQYKTFPGDWTDIPDSIGMNLTAGVLTDTTAFRRIVFSGNDKACIDSGGIGKTVIIMPLITHNSILEAPVQYTCYNTPVQLYGSDPQHGFGAETYAYQWEQSTDNLIWETVTETQRDFQSTNLTDTRYFRRTVFSTPENHECTDVSDTVEVRINPLPSGNVINNYDTLCAGETLYVKFNVAGNGPFDVTIRGEELTDQTKTDISASLDSIVFIPDATQQFKMDSIVDANGCYADVSGFIWVTPATVYEVPVANAGIDSAVCSDTYALQAVKWVPGSTGLWTATGAKFTNANDSITNVTVENYDPKVFTWTETNWQCADDDEVEITFHEKPLAAYAGADQVLDFNYTTQLQADPASVGKGKWSIITGAGEFNNDTLHDAVISEMTNTTMLKWTVTNGNCDATSDSMEILITPLVIKKGFTPNGDTKNDFFDIGAINAEQISIKVFNSAGVLVYESDDYKESEPWDGHNMNGVELPEGTYFYIANIKVAGKKEEVQFRSFVEILR
jgi:gliding motility-associated-like protein